MLAIGLTWNSNLLPDKSQCSTVLNKHMPLGRLRQPVSLLASVQVSIGLGSIHVRGCFEEEDSVAYTYVHLYCWAKRFLKWGTLLGSYTWDWLTETSSPVAFSRNCDVMFCRSNSVKGSWSLSVPACLSVLLHMVFSLRSAPFLSGVYKADA